MFLVELRDAFAPPGVGHWPVALIWTDPPMMFRNSPTALEELRLTWHAARGIRMPPNDSERDRLEIATAIRAATEPGELVADPFCGTGTTGVVALELGRNFYGCDTDSRMVLRTLTRLYSGHDPG